MLWDTGWWEPEGDPRAGLKKGHLGFILHGERLKGRWNLIRMRGEGKKERWLLIKEDDAQASRRANSEFLEGLSFSVKSGLSMDEIAGGEKAKRKIRTSAVREAQRAIPSPATLPKPALKAATPGNLMVSAWLNMCGRALLRRTPSCCTGRTIFVLPLKNFYWRSAVSVAPKRRAIIGAGWTSLRNWRSSSRRTILWPWSPGWNAMADAHHS